MNSEIKKLYRSSKNRMIAGVCSGVGDYFKTDPTIVRVVFVLLSLMYGVGILFYIILTLIIPKEDESGEIFDDDKVKERAKEIKEGVKNISHKAKEESAIFLRGGQKRFALLTLFIGLFFLAKAFFPDDWFRWDVLWPTIIILVSFYLLFKKEKRN